MDVVYWVQKFTIRNCSALVACFELVVFSSLVACLFCAHLVVLSSIAVVYFASIAVSVIIPSTIALFAFFLFWPIIVNVFFLHVRSFVVVSTFCCCCLPGEKDDAAAPHTVRLFSFSLLSILIIAASEK